MSVKNSKLNRSNEVKFNAPSNRRKGVVARSNKPALMTLTCHKKCGKRLSFGREVFEKLDSPSDVEISFIENYLVVRDGNGNGLGLSKVDTGKPILYVATLAEHIVEKYKIDLSEHTTVSFYEGFFEDDAYYIQLEEAPENVSDDDMEEADADELEEELPVEELSEDNEPETSDIEETVPEEDLFEEE
ncbi:MAG: hypothetical protein E7260_09165 [Lachnospiraceae bacterium]|nr:hypothetical protein [Lachnospiraceae bacterium]